MLRGGLALLALGFVIVLAAIYARELVDPVRPGASGTRAAAPAVPVAPGAPVTPSAPAAEREPAARPQARIDASAYGPPVGEIVPPPDRDVTPPDVTPGPPVEGPMVRAAGRLLPPRPPRPKKRKLARVIAVDAGTLTAGESTVTIAGILAPGLDETCTDGDGKTWPCGRVARAELRRLIRARAVVCEAAPEALPDAFTATCRIGNTDIGLWLIAQGWARPLDTAPEAYHDAAEKAEAARRGLGRARGLPGAR